MNCPELSFRRLLAPWMRTFEFQDFTGTQALQLDVRVSLRERPAAATCRPGIQAPTLDHGSDWYAVRSGEVSASGLLMFSIGPDGWDCLRLL